MYALSPISGRLTDRLGRVPGDPRRARRSWPSSAILAAVAPPDGGVVLFVALFLLGFGWNLGFVAGVDAAVERPELAERTRIQGVADALIWSSAAAASLGSGAGRGLRRLRGARDPGRGAGRRSGRHRATAHARPIATPPSRRAGQLAPAPSEPGSRPAEPGRQLPTTQAARTRAQASTSSSGTYSSALWATRTSPGPKMTTACRPR